MGKIWNVFYAKPFMSIIGKAPKTMCLLYIVTISRYEKCQTKIFIQDFNLHMFAWKKEYHELLMEHDSDHVDMVKLVFLSISVLDGT